jgi:NADH:ubiquinone oxidoreductase subunit 6 (subunit J)
MTAILVVIALVTLLAAAVAMSLRNVIHSALLLIASWAGIAAFYLWAGAEFVAFAQILVYVGAVSMIVLFAVLLTRRSRADLAIAPDSLSRAILGLLCGGAVCGVLFGAVLDSPLTGNVAPAPHVTVKELGAALGGPEAASLLVAGVLLTVALLGAVVLASINKEDAP